MTPDIKQITYKPELGEQFISLKIDPKTQEGLLENPELVQAISPVFEAVGNMQDKISGALGERLHRSSKEVGNGFKPFPTPKNKTV